MSNSTPSNHSGQQHGVTRSNSVSSSALFTMQRAASLSGSRPPATALRSQSPNDTNRTCAKLTKWGLSPEPSRGTSDGHSRQDSIGGIKEGIGNLNRWSQSTASSKSSVGHTRKNSFSRRLSFGGSGSIGSLAGFGASQSPQQSRNVLTKQRPSPSNSPKKQSSMTSPNVVPSTSLPPTVNLPPSSRTVNDVDPVPIMASKTSTTAPSLKTPTYSIPAPDYFGEKWDGLSPLKRRPSVQRTTTAPALGGGASSSSRRAPSPAFETLQASASSDSAISPLDRAPFIGKNRNQERVPHMGHSRNQEDVGRGSGGTEVDSSASSVRSTRERSRKHKSPSQKAMLSKALQKAHTAVLLDNAQNFEGAMEAYRDACALLRQVMMRSSGDEDKKKLESIVSTSTL